MDINGKIAVVTGSSSGVGAQVALQLAALGASVVVNYAKSRSGGEQVVEQIIAAGGKAVLCQADVGVDEQCRALVACADKEFGALDILVNNAGSTVYVEHEAMDLLSEDIWQTTLATNLLGPFYMSRAALDLMKVRGGGEIVMTSSIAGSTSFGSSMAYCASKAGLNSLTRNLAKALGKHNIRVNAIAPGLIDGRWASEGWGERWDDIKAHARSLTPLNAITTPEDIAQSIVSVIAGSDLMTGQVITMDGGFTTP